MKTPFSIFERAFRLARTVPLKELLDGVPSGFATRVICAASLVAVLTLALAKQPDLDERELASLVMNGVLEVQP